jgi:hypothetical protein
MWNRESINVTAKDHGYFPKTFTWRGRRHLVDAVEQCWTVAEHDWMRRALKHCFRVRTEEATYVVSHDLKRNKWFVETSG